MVDRRCDNSVDKFSRTEKIASVTEAVEKGRVAPNPKDLSYSTHV